MDKQYKLEEIVINGKKHQYKLITTYRRTIAIGVNSKNEIVVIGSKIVPKAYLIDFIKKNIEKMDKHIKNSVDACIVNMDKQYILLNNKKYDLIISEGDKNSYTIRLDKIYIKIKNKQSLNKVLKQIYSKKMERYIKDNKKLIQSYFNMLNIKQIPINHKWLKSRWGYCNIIKKNIYISDLLYAFTSTQINYVIIHEISHLLVGNHSRQFWNVVATIIPNYKQIRKDLKKGHIILN